MPGMDCEFLHMGRSLSDPSGYPPQCLACAFSVVGSQSYLYGALTCARQCAEHFTCVSQLCNNSNNNLYYLHLPRRKPSLKNRRPLTWVTAGKWRSRGWIETLHLPCPLAYQLCYVHGSFIHDKLRWGTEAGKVVHRVANKKPFSFDAQHHLPCAGIDKKQKWDQQGVLSDTLGAHIDLICHWWCWAEDGKSDFSHFSFLFFKNPVTSCTFN